MPRTTKPRANGHAAPRKRPVTLDGTGFGDRNTIVLPPVTAECSVEHELRNLVVRGESVPLHLARRALAIVEQVAPPPKIFVALPAYGQIVTAQTVSSLMNLTQTMFQHNLAGGFGTLSFPDISEIRNIFLTIWYDKVQTSHMLFVDADMGFDPQLILEMVQFNKPLVGALCPKRKLPIEFAGRAKTGQVQIVNGHMEVDGVGGALMLIRRDTVDGVLKKYPELSDEITVKNHAAKELMEAHGIKRLIRAFDKVVVEGETFSEDLSFCIRHRECGGEVWGNIMHSVTHVGPHEYSGRYYDHIKDFIRPTEAPVEVPLEAHAEMMPIDPAAYQQAAE